MPTTQGNLGLRLLLNQLFDQPARKEYFIRIIIQSQNLLGTQFQLVMHTTPETPVYIEQIRSYCDKVRIGETLNQAVERALKKFGIEVIDDITDTDIFETDYDRHGNLLPRYGVVASVPKIEHITSPFPDMYVSWLPESTISILPSEQDTKVTIQRTSGDTDPNIIIQKLDDRGFFRFTPTQDKQKAKELLRKSLLKKEFSTFDPESHKELDGRTYASDEENLYDGFMASVFRTMQPILEREGVRLTAIEDDEITDDSHYLTINGLKHLIYHCKEPYSQSRASIYWGIAHKRLLEIINELLDHAGSQERVYGQLVGNEAMVMVLTQPLFEYIQTLPISAYWVPYTSQEKESDDFNFLD